MKLVEELVRHLAETVLGSLKIKRPIKRILDRNLQSAADILRNLAKKATEGTEVVEDNQIESALNRFHSEFGPIYKKLRSFRGELDSAEPFGGNRDQLVGEMLLERVGEPLVVHVGELLGLGASGCDDVVPAVAQGIPVAWINRKGQQPAGAARPDREFRTLTELADWLA